MTKSKHKNIWLIGAGLLLMLAVGCDNRDPLPANHFRVNFDKTEKIGVNNVSVTFQKLVEDSRCPKNAYCIWAGQAVIDLEINDGWVGSLTLNVEDQAAKKLIYEGYEYTLIDVLPYPDADKLVNEKQYEIILKIAKP